MSLILAALLANQALPFIDRPALRVLAKQEAAQGKRPRPIKASSERTTADACVAVNVADTSSRLARGRAYSMLGPRVSILETTCALRRTAAGGGRSTQLASR